LQTNNYKLALKLYDNKQYKSSIELCTGELHKLDAKDSLFTKFLLLRADDFRALNDFKSGIKDYTSLMELHPKDVLYYVGLGYFYGEDKDYADCFFVLKNGLKIDPRNIYILNNLSYYSNQAGDFQNGLIFANNALSLSNDPYWKGVLFNNRGYSNIGLRKYNLALNDINEAIRLSPDNSYAYCYRALANIGLKQFETVCSDLSKAKNLGAVNLTADLIKQYCQH
jgi:tetratricopeptide (TPR) repeat protein